MRKDDILKIEITDIGVNGEGIGKIEGYTLFVKDAIIGDVIEAKLIKAKKNYGYGRLMKILTPSPDRVAPVCPMARKCGGCQIQEMSYKKQLEFKEKKVRGNLTRIGEVPEELLDNIMEPIVGMEESAGLGAPFYYRNKAQFPVGADKKGEAIAGFYAGRTHSIISNTNCVLGVKVNERILNLILDFMKEYNIEPYNETAHTGVVRHVLIRYGFRTKEIMVCLVVNADRLPHSSVLAKRLARIEGMTSITLNVNKNKTNVILGEQIKVLWGQEYITDYIGDVKYQISPLSFYQVNPVQTEKLYKIAMEYAGIGLAEEKEERREEIEKRKKIVWDLYCGIGTISLFLARKGGKVYGVEIVPQAIDDARNNARINGIENVEFIAGKAEEVLPEYFEEYEKSHGGKKAHADVIVVDPPRKGCEESLLKTIVDMEPERIVYVSCDSATLARDVKYLREKGYELKKIQAVDQFPHTVHVETVVMLSHKKPDSVINVKVEFGEGEGKVPLDNIAKRAEAYKPKERVTYKMIKGYIEAKYGFKVHTAYIAEVKRDLGLPMYDAPNAVEKLKQPRKHPTAEKVEAIKDALKHFEVI